MNSTQETGN